MPGNQGLQKITKIKSKNITHLKLVNKAIIAILYFLGNLPASELLVPTFWNFLAVPSSQAYSTTPTKTEWLVSSEMSALKAQTPGEYPENTIWHSTHGESLKSRKAIIPKKNHISIYDVENFRKAARDKRQENSFHSQISDQYTKSNFPHSFTLAVQISFCHWYIYTTFRLTHVQTVYAHLILRIYTVNISLILYIQTVSVHLLLYIYTDYFSLIVYVQTV